MRGICRKQTPSRAPSRAPCVRRNVVVAAMHRRESPMADARSSAVPRAAERPCPSNRAHGLLHHSLTSPLFLPRSLASNAHSSRGRHCCRRLSSLPPRGSAPPSAWQPCILRHRLRRPLLVLARPSSAFLRRCRAWPRDSHGHRAPAHVDSEPRAAVGQAVGTYGCVRVPRPFPATCRRRRAFSGRHRPIPRPPLFPTRDRDFGLKFDKSKGSNCEVCDSNE